MKQNMIKVILPVMALLLFSVHGFSQNTIELLGAPGAGGPIGVGASSADQTVTFYTDTTTAFSPTLTATFSLSNQQFTAIEGNPGSPGTQFGGTSSLINTSVGGTSIYPRMNSISNSINGNYTACNSCIAGTGINTSLNRSIELYNFSDALIDSTGNQLYPLNARIQYADLTITFSTPVNNPILHLTGLGGDVYDTIQGSGGTINYTQGFSTEFDLLTPGLSLSKLSGNAALVVGDTQIINGAAHFSFPTTPAPEFGVMRSAATGSVVVQGNNITSFTLRIFLHGDGGTITNNAGTTVAATNGNIVRWAFHGSFSNAGLKVSGDGFLLGLSLEESGTVLPVSLTSFTIAASNNEALLNWQTASEGNNKGFEIERSADGSVWNSIGFTNSKANMGNSNVHLDYAFIDNAPLNGLNLYRLKQIDFDNRFQYSTVRTIVFGTTSKVMIYPNPTSGQLYILMPDGWIGNPIGLDVVNSIGQVMISKQIENANKKESLQVSSLSDGIYFLKLRQLNGAVDNIKIQILKH